MLSIPFTHKKVSDWFYDEFTAANPSQGSNSSSASGSSGSSAEGHPFRVKKTICVDPAKQTGFTDHINDLLDGMENVYGIVLTVTKGEGNIEFISDAVNNRTYTGRTPAHGTTADYFNQSIQFAGEDTLIIEPVGNGEFCVEITFIGT